MVMWWTELWGGGWWGGFFSTFTVFPLKTLSAPLGLCHSQGLKFFNYIETRGPGS